MNIFTAREQEELVGIIHQDDLTKLINWLDSKHISVDRFLRASLMDTETVKNQDSEIKNPKKRFANSHCYGLLISLSAPLDLSGAFGAEQIFLYLWKKALPEQQLNVVFACFKGRIVGTSNETKACKIIDIIMDNTSGEQLVNIMKNENIFGLRPLEVAMQYGFLKLFFKILKVPGLYLIEEENLGVSKRFTFDMSEYSPFTTDPKISRYWKSPLRLLQNITKDLLPAISETELLTNGLIFLWYKHAFKHCRILFYIYSIGTIYHAILINTGILPYTYSRIYTYWYTEMLNENGTENKTYSTVLQQCTPEEHQNWKSFYLLSTPAYATYALFSSLIFYSYQVVVHTILQVKIATEHRSFTPRFARVIDSETITNHNVFMVGRYLNLILLCVLAVTHYYPLETIGLSQFSAYVVTVDIFTITTSLFTIFDTVFYLTFVPKIGGTVMLFLRSIETLVAFLLIYFASLIGFALLLVILSPCLEYAFFVEDSILLSAFFTVFRMTLNIIDVPNESLSRLWFLQFILVIMVPIFILNFIIAIIADRVSYLSANQSTILSMHNLHVIMICESSYRLFPAPLLLEKIYGKIDKNCFQVTQLRNRRRAKHSE